MSSNLIKIIAGVFVVLAFFLAFVAFKMSRSAYDTAARAPQAVQAAPSTDKLPDIVVAAKPLFANQPIDASSVKVIKTDTPPVEYYTKVDDVKGMIPSVDVDVGAPLTPRLFDADPIAKLIPPGNKAVSLILTDVIGIGGFVRAADVVDVLVYLRNDQGNKIDPAQARILLKDALVLASDERIIPPPSVEKSQNGQQQQAPQPHHERTVVIAVPDAEVPRVMLGASLGEVRLALHSKSPDQPQAPAADAAAAPAVPAKQVAAADQPLPDMPITSAELARLKPPHPSQGAPQGIVIYRGSKGSTVYP